jgi:hypothetical protein
VSDQLADRDHADSRARAVGAQRDHGDAALTFSNVGYLASFIPVLVGYYLLRKERPNLRRPFKLPE